MLIIFISCGDLFWDNAFVKWLREIRALLIFVLLGPPIVESTFITVEQSILPTPSILAFV